MKQTTKTVISDNWVTEDNIFLMLRQYTKTDKPNFPQIILWDTNIKIYYNNIIDISIAKDLRPNYESVI